MLSVLLFLLLIGPTRAAAGEAMTVAEAEYHRLHAEMSSLAAREAWPGVERAYQKLLATGIAPAFEDHVAGAHAASNEGDLATARERLEAANAVRVDRDVIEWLWTIDTTYGEVRLHAPPGAVLELGTLPFDPVQKRAFERARDTVASTGAFAGYLPAGDYDLRGTRFTVTAGQDAAVVDVRTERERKKAAQATN